MSHLLEAPVGGVDAAPHDAEAPARHLLAQKIILGEENLFVESAQLPEFFQVEEHEHPCREGMMQTREMLEHIVADINQLVDPVPAAAQDVCGYAVKLLALCEFDSAAD